MAELNSREHDGPAELELTYSTLRDTNRARPTIGMLAVCIIQVLSSGYKSANGAKNLRSDFFEIAFA
jgi:hypothetical protein